MSGKMDYFGGNGISEVRFGCILSQVGFSFEDFRCILNFFNIVFQTGKKTSSFAQHTDLI